MANIKSIGGNPIVLDASGIAPGAVTPDKLADMDGITAGASNGITGNGPTESAAWLQRVSTGDGPTTIRSIHGNTIVESGALVSVNMTGIESTGFNQWDEEWELGSYNTTNGEKAAATMRIRCKNPIPVFPDTDYYLNFGSYSLGSQGLDICFYDANGDFLSFLRKWSAALTIPAGVHYMTWSTQPAYGPAYKNDICINLSDPTRNGTYEPHWQSERTIDVATYFPNGMRSAGTVYDELTETQAITRIGERAYQSGDESDATVVTDGIVTHYALAAPTTVEIDPPINLTYRTAAGGIERVMVPTGETSAPPTIVAAQGYTAESLRDAALSAIAPVENGKASTNYGIGSYLVHDGQLCRVTVAIASGEAITIGTNVTATTVMAEVIALIAQ